MLTKEKLVLFDLILKHVTDSIIVVELEPSLPPEEATIIYVNDAFTQVLEYTTHEVLGKAFSLLHLGKISVETLEELRLLLQKQRPFLIEMPCFRKDETAYWAQFRAVPVFDEDGTCSHWMYLCQNMTHKIEAAIQMTELAESLQEALNSSIDVNIRLQLFETAVERTTDCVLITEAEPVHGPSGPKIVYCNKAFSRLTGYASEEVLGKTPHILQGPETDQGTIDVIRAALDAWEPVDVELQNYKKDGTPYWVELSITPIADNSGWYTHWVSVQRDITERKEAELKLKELSENLQVALNASEKRNVKLRLFETVVRHTHDGIVITEKDTQSNEQDDKIVFVNEAFTLCTGYTAEEVLGKTARFLHGTVEGGESLRKIQGALDKMQTVEVEILNYKKDGSPFWSELNIVPITDEHGTFTHWASVQRDITERKEADLKLRNLTTQLQDALVKAREAAVAKEQFLATMSHEIRTPMNGVIGVASLLLDTPLNDEQREYLKLINDSGEHLLSIINDILDYSKIESGHLDINNQAFSLRSHINAVIASFKPQLNARGLDIAYNCAPIIPETVVGDSIRLRQILVNLISNAIKFTEEGGIRIDIQPAELKQGDRPYRFGVQFSVKDTGIGISEENQHRLFKSFSQADASTSRKYGGTGLGLAISKRLTELMGGTIWCESAPGEGATFHFTINFGLKDTSKEFLPELEPTEGSKETTIPLDGYWQGKRALIINENHTDEKILGYLLINFGLMIGIADDEDLALDAIHSSGIDLVFVGIYTASSTNLDFVRRVLDTTPEEVRPLVVGLVNHPSNEERFMCMANGVDAILSTPFNSEELVRVMNILSAPASMEVKVKNEALLNRTS